MGSFMLKCLLIPLLLTVSIARAQKVFRGHITFNGDPERMAAFMPVYIQGQGEGSTGSNGHFVISIQESCVVATLTLGDNKFTIISPAGGVVKIPADPDEEVEIVIGDSPKIVYIKEIANKEKVIKDSLIKIGLKEDKIEKRLDEYFAEVQKGNNMKIDSFRNQVELEEERLDFYPVFSSSVNNYINEAKDIKDAFAFSAGHAFDDPRALKILTDAVASYNVAYKEINSHHAGYEKEVLDLWHNENDAADVKDLFRFMLGDVHNSHIYSLNLIVNQINDYNQGNIKGSKKNAKAGITDRLNLILFELNHQLPELDTRAQLILSKLKN